MKTEVTTAFTKEAIKSIKPRWATWLFRGTLIITSVAVFVIASDPAVPSELAVRLTVYLKAIDLVVLGFSNMFGIKVKDDEN